MSVLNNLEPKKVFSFFEQLSSIPRGSGNMKGIADYCVAFAEKYNLKYVRDNSDNVVIYKNGTGALENAEPIILQGHLDMVCQKTDDSDIDFEKDGLSLYIDGDFVKAKGTTLGADNGIAVAMVLSILSSNDLIHPPIEAVFTTDEEVGMFGAIDLDGSLLSAKRMINLDSEDEDCVTISCAGGSDFNAFVPLTFEEKTATEVTLTLCGLQGGHSGVCINEGRQNANILAGRVLSYLNDNCDFSLVSVNGGDKCNAITLKNEIRLLTLNPAELQAVANQYGALLKSELSAREPNFDLVVLVGKEVTEKVMTNQSLQKVILALAVAPNGVIEMSKEIENLVETSLNLGILKTNEDNLSLTFALRSNKKTALKYLEEKLTVIYKSLSAQIKTGGHYPPWEYNPNSKLQSLYIETYTNQFGKPPRVEALHAGLECGVFADKLGSFDAIAIGPQMYDVHTVGERLSISSTAEIYKLLIKILSNCQ